MPQQTDSATRVALRSIDTHLVGRKVRVAGRVLSYDVTTGLLVLLDSNVNALVVDTQLAIDGEAGEWARERLSKIMIIGLIERLDESTTIPSPPPNAPRRLAVNKVLILRAILLVPAPDLDLALWNEVVDEEEEHEDD